MKVIIEPQWSFAEALEAAWQAYRTNGLEARTNRKRVLEKWANVVGRHRAVSELEAFLLENNDLTLTPHIVRELKKQFKAMPEVTPFTDKLDVESSSLNKAYKNRFSNIDAVLNQFIELARELEVDPISKLINALAEHDSELVFDENTISKFFGLSQKNSAEVIAKLINWMTELNNVEDVIFILEKLNADDLQKLNAAIGLSNLKGCLDTWKNNMEHDSEDFWQDMFARNSFLFGQLFSYPTLLIEEKAYIGGKSISNKGGNIIDFLFANGLTKNTALVEIKTPTTKLLSSKYRGDIFNISSELSGSIMQIVNYKNSLLQNYIMLSNAEGNKFEVFDPSCIVIIGNAAVELADLKRRKSLELFRMGLKSVQVVTYDELFGKVELLVNLLEQNIVD